MSSLLSTRRNFIPRRYEPGERRIIKEGTKKFDEAKSCFQLSVNLDIFGQEAESLFHRTMSWVQGKVGLFQNKPQQNLHISELKISGNNSFFQAAKLKNQAVDMIRTRNYQMALNKYPAALSKYQEAKKNPRKVLSIENKISRILSLMSEKEVKTSNSYERAT